MRLGTFLALSALGARLRLTRLYDINNRKCMSDLNKQRVSDFLRKYDLVIFPVGVFAVVSGSEGWGSQWIGLEIVDGLLLAVGILGLVVSLAYLSKRSA